MRKRVFGRHLSRGRKSREALIVTLIRALVLSGKIETTRAKAKAIIGQVDKVVKIARKGTLSSQRQVSAFMRGDREVVTKLINEIVPSTSGRTSGLTRIISLPARRGDTAAMARLEWVDEIKPAAVKEKVEKKKVVKKAPKKVVKKAVSVKKTKVVAKKKVSKKTK